ncbi:hypothetical protein FQA47_001523 [Oryzias melastigma]|uniref:Uncharacterized protein n=1 Tax=Oryzias melastigma TaxID=30732 RepID=A0A834FRL2_ORYME|nr:hypothetical protein FQA47_001523 [Oryzias melastigma]
MASITPLTSDRNGMDLEPNCGMDRARVQQDVGRIICHERSRCRKEKQIQDDGIGGTSLQKENVFITHICSLTKENRNFSFPESLSFFLQTGMITGKTHFS